jgi:hypothetical protein
MLIISAIATGDNRCCASEHLAGSLPRRQLSLPPEVSAIMRMNLGKALPWIHEGQFPAINVAGAQTARPIYRISQAALAEFEQSRQVSTARQQIQERPRWLKPESAVREFY